MRNGNERPATTCKRSSTGEGFFKVRDVSNPKGMV
jgi:hypothetical protein